jgi:hypothetical protein
VRVVRLNGIQSAQDVIDWITARRKNGVHDPATVRDELVAFVKAAPYYHRKLPRN